MENHWGYRLSELAQHLGMWKDIEPQGLCYIMHTRRGQRYDIEFYEDTRSLVGAMGTIRQGQH